MTTQISEAVNAVYGDIDALINEGSSWYNTSDRWTKVLLAVEAALAQLEAEARAELLARVERDANSGRWDMSNRQVPELWLDEEALALHTSTLRLCRALVIHNYSAQPQTPPQVIAQLLRSPLLEHIEWIALRVNPLGGDVLSALCARSSPRLSYLSLGGCGIGREEVAALCASEALLGNLTTLNLSYNKIDAAGAELLAGCAWLAQLEVLELRENKIGQAGRVALGKSPHLSAKAKVSARAIATSSGAVATGGREVFGDVRSALQEPPGAHVWAKICDLVSRQDAEQAINETAPYVAQALSRWPAKDRPLMALWQEMLLNGDAVPPAAYLARSMHVSNYKMNAQRAGRLGKFVADAGVAALTLEDGELSGKVVGAYFLAHDVKALREVNFWYCPEGDDLAVLCDRAPYRLERLGFGKGSLREQDIEALRTGRCVQGLRALEVRATSLELGGWRDIAQAPWWSGLESLDVRLDGYGARDEARSAAALAPALAGEAAWGKLARLGLRTPRLQEPLKGVDVGALAARLPALRSLALSPVEAGDAAFGLIEAVSDRIERLELEHVEREGAALTRALERLELGALRALKVDFEFYSYNYEGMPTEAPMAWPQAACWVGLSDLELGGLALNDVQLAQALSALPVGLERLSAGDIELGEQAAQALAGQALEQLHTLELTSVKVMTPAALERLTRAPWWQGLESLTIYERHGDKSALGALAGRLPAGLKTLRLRSHTEAGVVTMIKAGLPAGLEVVAIQSGALATKGFTALVERLGELPRLHTLDLDNNTITAKALEVLLASPQLGQIPIITMRSNRLGFAGKQRVLDTEAASVAFKGCV